MECCGTCEHHKVLLINHSDEWCCSNEESENYMLETDYGDCCIDYEERRGFKNE